MARWVEERNMMSADISIGGHQLDGGEQYAYSLVHHVREQFPINGVPADIATALLEFTSDAKLLTEKGKKLIQVLRFHKVERPGASD